MKANFKKFLFLILATGLVSPFTIFAQNQPSAENTGAKVGIFCSRLSELAAKMSQRIGNNEGKIAAKRIERTGNITTRRSQRDAKLAENRVKWDAKRGEHYAK